MEHVKTLKKIPIAKKTNYFMNFKSQNYFCSFPKFQGDLHVQNSNVNNLLEIHSC